MIGPALRKTAIYALEALAALLALAAFAAGLVLWRLAAGPIEADVLKSYVEEALMDAFGGAEARVGAVTLAYDPGAATLVLAAEDIAVRDINGEIIGAAQRLEGAFALERLLIGRLELVRLEARGGDFAVVRDRFGNIAAGLGRPERVRAASSPRGGEPALLARMNDALAQTNGPLSRLEALSVSGVRLWVVDQGSMGEWIVQNVTAEAAIEGEAIEARFSGALATTAGRAPISLRIQTDAELERLFLDVRAENLSPAALAPQRGAAAPLGAFDAPVAVELVVDAARGTGLNAATLSARAGAGVVRAAGTETPIDGAEILLVYDTALNEIRLETFALDALMLDVSLQGRIFNLGGFATALPGRAEYEITSGPGVLTLPAVFPQPLAWNEIALSGALAPVERAMTFETFSLDLANGARGDFTGALAFEDVDGRRLPSIELSGPITGVLGPQDVLAFWPLEFALGARDWIEAGVLDGRLENAFLALDIDAEAIAARYIEDEALNLTFDFSNADVLYVSTMTPLRGAAGSAVLRGNSFSLEGDSGAIGDLQFERLFVEIPRLNPKGATARFGGAGTGRAADFIALIDEPPLSFASAYGIEPAAFTGEGRITFEIFRPMRRFVSPDRIDFNVEGAFTGVGGPAGLRGLRFENADVALTADKALIEAFGTADVGPLEAEITWRETLDRPEGAPGTTILVAADATGRDLDALGLPVRRYFDGIARLNAEVFGRGFDLETIDLELDLADAAVVGPGQIWSKAPGEPAIAAFSIRIDDEAGLALERFEALSEGLEVRAQGRLGADGRLLEAQAERVFIADLVDVALQADRPQGPEGPLRLALDGAFLDARGLLLEARRMSFGGDPVGAPILFSAELDAVAVAGGVYENVAIGFQTSAEGIERVDFAADGEGGPLSAHYGVVPETEGRRLVEVETADACALIEALAGTARCEGGAMRLTGEAPPRGQPGGFAGRLEAHDYVMEDIPFLARILGAASIDGLATLFGDGGVAFDTLEMAFVWQAGVLEMRNGRAAGPALGLTWRGLVDFPQDEMVIDGTIVPSYGLNTVLGDAPVVGEALTSRDGEGVIGVTFSVQGPFEATRVFANPLSALAPGLLRRAFEGSDAADALRAREAARAAEAALETAIEAETGAPGENAPQGSGESP